MSGAGLLAAADRETIEGLLGALAAEIERHPTWPDLRHKAALAHLELGRPAEAKGHLAAALERNPRYLDAARALAFTELALGEPARAREAASRLLDCAPVWRAQLALGLVLAAEGRDLDGARRHLDLACAEAPDRPLPHYALALVRARAADLAADDTRKTHLASEAPLSSVAAAIRAEAAARARALGVEPPGEAALANPGRALLLREAAFRVAAQGDREAAERLLDRAAALDLELGIDAAARADLAFAAGDVDDAVAGFRRAIERDMDLVKPRISLAYALGIKGDLEGAIAELQAAARLRPSYPDVRYQLGALYLERAEHARAARELEAALALNPRYGAAHFALGQARFAQGDFAGAAAALERADDGTCQREEVLAHLGFAHLKVGALDLAEKAFADAIALDDSLPAPHLGRALAAEARGDASAARAHLGEYDRLEHELGNDDAAALRKRLGG